MSNYLLIDKKLAQDSNSWENPFKYGHEMSCDNLQTTKYNLILYRALNKSENDVLYRVNKSNWVFVVGSFLYKGKGFKKSLELIYSDFKQSQIQFDSIIGQFSLLIVVEGKVNIINDSLGIIRTFSSNNYDILSSSFIGAWFARPTRSTLNSAALLEKISVGYVIAPDTLINEVVDITFMVIEREGLLKQSVMKKKMAHPRNENIYYAKACLDNYFEVIKRVASPDKISLGLSGGFDSRLILSVIKEYTNKYLYSHCTVGVHSDELRISNQIALQINERLHVHKTNNAEKLSKHKSFALLKDLFYYFDGRTANNSGAFSFTGSYEYNVKHLHSIKIGLNGKGGEVLRNYYQLPNRKYYFKDWFRVFECYPSFSYMFDDKTQNKILCRIENKVNLRFGRTNHVKWNRWNIQRYYSEIRQSDCEGSIISAHNKITNYFSPFLDGNLLNKLYKTFYQTFNDKFISRLISLYSQDIAGVTSKYGHNFVFKPLKIKVKELIVKNSPLIVRRIKRERDFCIKTKNYNRNTQFDDSIKVLERMIPDINWDVCRVHYAQRNVVHFLSNLVREGEKNNKL